jgi:hypothetical protein
MTNAKHLISISLYNDQNTDLHIKITNLAFSKLHFVQHTDWSKNG